ncbi:polysaccharide pyruvyl transferase family protein [Amaricoccus sp. W119]|uniref:polysaccharide pyruvyl transferase family protein n=1 Tax=Amaricoccus sp. W119 TaxID=3391833 RepID=UPI0039A53644
MSTPSRMAARFFYSAKTQYFNAGDALINRELLRLLRARGTVEIARCDAPEEYLSQLALGSGEARHGGRPGLIAAAFGAGLRYRLGLDGRRPYLALTPGDPFWGFGAGTILTGLSMVALSIAGVRPIRLGVSFARRDPARLRWEAWMSRWGHALGLRDAASLEITRRAGFARVSYFPDLALTLPVRPRAPRPAEAPLRIAVSCRLDKLGREEASLLRARLADILAHLSAAGPVSVAFVSQVRGDGARMNADFEDIAARYKAEVIESIDLDALALVYRDTDLVLSNRLHSLLYAAAQGCLPLGLLSPAHDYKISGLLDTAGLADFWESLDARSPGFDLARLEAGRPAIRRAFETGAATATAALADLLGAPVHNGADARRRVA